MQDIDFLPVQYQREHVRRQSQPWRFVVATAFALLLAAAAYTQHHRKQRAAEELAAIEPHHELVLAQQSQLAEIQSRLVSARARAELLTYLRHPWPRTQLLGALLPAMPDEVTFGQLQITSREPAGQIVSQRRTRSQRHSEAEEDARLGPAQRDLKRLRGQCDHAETVLLLSGTTTDSAALHEYLGKLGNSQLIAKAEVDWIEVAEDAQAAAQEFSAILIVRPGYGLPDGPSGSPEAASGMPRNDKNTVSGLTPGDDLRSSNNPDGKSRR